MAARIGIRREDKSVWERRVPLTPQDAAEIQRQEGIEVMVQSSSARAFSGDEFAAAGVPVQDDLADCPVVLGIKEMPESFFRPGGAYVFFAHVIKGQPYNMPMLRRVLDLGCTLIDYERVVDEQNRRLIFFGWHAGVAGCVDTLWALGQRLAWEGIDNPFTLLRPTYTYHDVAEAKEAFREVGARIERWGVPAEVRPLIVGVAGYGNVARGVQEMLELLPIVEVEPEQVVGLTGSAEPSRGHLYKATFKEWHMVQASTPGAKFELQDYYRHPEKYRGTFEQYLPHLTVLMNAIFWTPAYPRLVTKSALRALFGDAGLAAPRLRVIGDISCDIEGAIECTSKSTDPDESVYVYNPFSEQVADGHAGPGVVVMAVDILPAELPRDASTDFSRVLRPFIPAIARCDFTVPFDQCSLPAPIKRAVIAYQGRLTPEYEYIAKYLT